MHRQTTSLLAISLITCAGSFAFAQESKSTTSAPARKTPTVAPITSSRTGNPQDTPGRRKNVKDITSRSLDGQVKKRQVEVPEPTVVLKPGEVPDIKFDTPSYDFGRIKAGPFVEHEYWFTNTGTGPLEILSVKPS